MNASPHRWSGWPGAWCLDCGIEDPWEIALADGRIDFVDDPDAEGGIRQVVSDELRAEMDAQMICPCPGAAKHDPYQRKEKTELNNPDPFAELAVELSAEVKAKKADEAKVAKRAPAKPSAPVKMASAPAAAANEKEKPPVAEEDDNEPVELVMDEVDIDLDASQFIPTVRDVMLEQFKHRPKDWGKMSESEQRDMAAQIEEFATRLVREILEHVASGEHQTIRCLLESYTEKDGIKLAMKVAAFGDEESEQAVLFCHRARGKHVMLRLATIDEYRGDKEAEVDADEPEIDWDAEPENPHTGSNEDLADGDEGESVVEKVTAEADAEDGDWADDGDEADED